MLTTPRVKLLIALINAWINKIKIQNINKTRLSKASFQRSTVDAQPPNSFLIVGMLWVFHYKEEKNYALISARPMVSGLGASLGVRGINQVKENNKKK